MHVHVFMHIYIDRQNLQVWKYFCLLDHTSITDMILERLFKHHICSSLDEILPSLGHYISIIHRTIVKHDSIVLHYSTVQCHNIVQYNSTLHHGSIVDHLSIVTNI